MTIQDFRTSPLPEEIIHALLAATYAYAEMDVLIKEYPQTQSLLSNMLLALDVYYQHYDARPNIADICHALFITDKTNVVGESVTTFAECLAYARNKVVMTEVLTAGDILRINSSIRDLRTEPLSFDVASADCEQIVESIWSILHDLYSPQRQHPLLLEAAIACYCLLILPKSAPISLQTLAILFSNVYQSDVAFCGLLRQWTLSTDPRIHISSMETINALVHILEIFQNMWAYGATLLRLLRHRKAEIIHLISGDFSQQISAGVSQMLSESLCIKRRDVSNRLQLSPKTVTKILKQLEQRNILHSVKSWREMFYFNSLMIDTLKEQL